ncbi:hypothetical protein A3A66_01135 [Microgenomates group bacterium RIFCSPLOWO2_01_FULL_46_13]|nr:MAG: hypothetical protein A2783_01120 [Microgenomates group bacterium RIFCSPHIGHO2_01_FULL_45_11]OGV94608.1 MAG: hypothetical protein A3A66_01135 [Microgenomates group bacterium RIFCSPLOWO2_01_FULL_46_13]
MCLAVPLQVKKAGEKTAMMTDGREVALGLVGKVRAKQWLLVKSNLAVEKLKASEVLTMQQVLKGVVNAIRS